MGSKERCEKSIWIKWDVVCSPIERGDLGIKNLEVFNRTLAIAGCGSSFDFWSIAICRM